MTMSAGAYSKRNRGGTRKDLDCLKSHDREEMASRGRLLQMETNRRRKAQVVRRKMDAMKEERRRQEILMKRREQIREATERYQRLKKNYIPGNGDAQREQAIPALDEALSAIRSSSAGQQRQAVPTHPCNQYSPRSAGASLRSPAGYYPHQRAQMAGRKRPPADHTGDALDQTFVYETSPGHDAAGSSLHARQLHTHSLRNLHASRNLFEQQLVQQQEMLVEQQKESLRMFDNAIKEELQGEFYDGNNGIANGGGDCAAPLSAADVLQCNSPTSVDSLEVTVPGVTNGSKSDVLVDSLESHFVTRPSGMEPDNRAAVDAANTAFMQHSRSFSSPNSNVAVVMPCFVQHRDELTNDMAAKLKEDRNNNNLGKERAYVNGTTVNGTTVNGTTVNRCDPFSVANNAHFYQDLVINRVSVVNGSNGRTMPVSAGQMTDWKGGEMDGCYSQMDNVWARPLIDTEMTRTRYHTSSAPLSTTATIEGGNVVYSHNQMPVEKRAFCIPPEKVEVVNVAVNSATPKEHDTAYTQVAQAVSVVRTQAVPVSMTIPSAVAMTAPSSTTSYHCSQTVPGSFVTVSNVYTSQVLSNGMLQYGKPVSAPPVLQWQAVSADRPGAKKPSDCDATGGVAVTLTPPTTTVTATSIVTSASKSSSKMSAPKSILKQREEDPTVIPAPRHRLTPGSARMRHNGRNIHVKDSVEIAREHQKKKAAKTKKKKSVRFADMDYEDTESSVESSEPSEDSEGDDKRFFITSTKTDANPTPEKPKKSMRPISAQTSGSSDSIDPVVREPRSLSAGTQRSRLCLQPHPPSQPPSGRAAMAGNGWKNSKMVATTAPVGDTATKAKPNTNNSAVEGATAVKEPPKSSPEVIRGINGLSLSRTPTDDEISKLWQKVRSCLNSTRTSQAGPAKSGAGEATPVTTQPAVSHKYMDGQSIVAQLRVGGQSGTAGYVNFQREPRTRVRHKFSMAALNHYNSKKGGLLQQRRPSGTVVVSYVPKPMSSAPPRSITQHFGYKQMTHGKYGGTVATETSANHGLSDSMASFLKAEELSGQPTLTESQIEETLERARQRQHAHSMLRRPSQKAPSTLSLEEQRLMQSLDRLNQRLQANEARQMRPPSSHHTFANYQPRPPDLHEESQQEELAMNNHAEAQAQAFAQGEAQTEPHTGMFRGRPPLTGSYRGQRVNLNPNMMRRQPFRGGITR